MLKIGNLHKQFDTSYTPTLNNINLTLNKGDFCILIGSNGSGKSTFLKAITGEHKVDSGFVKLNSVDLTNQSISKRAKWISSVTQDLNLGSVAEMTILENIVLSYLRSNPASFKFYENHKNFARKLLAELGCCLEDYIDFPLQQLSGGQKQMIATSMALLSNPSLLLLDEHTSALDPKAKARLMQYTSEKIAEHCLTTLMVTHNLEDALKYGNRLIMLHYGQIVLDIQGAEKSNLTLSQLLNLFHQNDDEVLLK